MKKVYDAPSVKLDIFATEDVITVSGVIFNSVRGTIGSADASVATVDGNDLDFN